MKELDEINEDELDLQSDGDGAEAYEHYRLQVDAGQTSMRVDRYIVEHIPRVSRTKVQAAADAGNIRVNDKPVKANYKTKPLDEIVIMMSYPPNEYDVVPEKMDLNIVYEDDDVLVVNKPAGICVHPAPGNFEGTLVNGLAYHLKDLPMFADVKDPRPGLVHRIDKDTSGLLVVAKTDRAKMSLAQQFFDKTTERTYIALVWGQMEADNGTIRGNIGRNIRDRKLMDVFPEGSEIGKHAVTHYEVLERLGYVTLVRCRLETGRTHQIRVHFKHVGHPLFGDQQYGGDQILRGTTFPKYRQFVQNCLKALPRQALHAKTLGFTHPTTGEFLRFDSEVEPKMMATIDKWRTYIASRES